MKKWMLGAVVLALGAGIVHAQVALDAEEVGALMEVGRAQEALVPQNPPRHAGTPPMEGIVEALNLGTDFPVPEIALWATLDSPAREAACVGAYRPLSLAESAWRRPQTYQVAALAPWLNPDAKQIGLTMILAGVEQPPPDATHWDRHGTKWMTGAAVASGALLASDQGWLGGDSESKPSTLIQQETGRDGTIVVGTGNTTTQGDVVAPLPVEAEAPAPAE